MNLQYIKTDACPICGCTEVVRESVNTTANFDSRQIQVHANRGQWETREFLCDKRIHYTPNYNKEEFTCDCAFNPEVVKMKEKRKTDKEKLLKFCEENDIAMPILHELRF